MRSLRLTPLRKVCPILDKCRRCSKMCAVVQFCTFATSGDVFDRPYDWNQSPLIIPSYFTTQMDMLKSGENNNRAANPPGYLLSDIKRRSLSSLSDRILYKMKIALLLTTSNRAFAISRWLKSTTMNHQIFSTL